jgi:taurine dioxygenase
MTLADDADSTGLDVRPLAGGLGAEVLGIDLAQPMPPALAGAVRAAWHRHLVLVFRDQRLTPAQQVAFTRWLGPVEPHPLGTRAGLPGDPEVLVLENRPGTRAPRNDTWHSDISFAERPPMASALYALEVPDGHGDTMFANMYAAYEQLSPGLRRLLKGLRALHGAEYLVARARAGDNAGRRIEKVPEPVSHPVVRTHPETGRQALYVNPAFTLRFEDMTASESRPLLELLHERAVRPENVYRHRWRRHDLLLWDNRCAMHYAIYDYDDSMVRHLHRTTAAGDRPA